MTATGEQVGVDKSADATGERACATARVSWWAYAGASLAALAPCFWQPRIQAGDLSSHLYNAWLAQLIERGQAPGLTLARQSNNILFDWMLSGLLRAFGPGAAERVAVSAAVLVFFWGAFAFVWSCARPAPARAPWHVAPCLAMLAYGWVFHMGLFNFYLSLGLCFAALAVVRRGKRGAVLVFPLLGIAYVAHALPVGWAAGVLLYDGAARALAPRYRIPLLAGALTGLAGLAALLCARFGGRWVPSQLMAISGAEQTWVYAMHYAPIAAAVLAIWVLWFQRMLETRGAERTILDVRFQLWLLCAAGVVVIPGEILLPGMRHTLNVMAERMSLATAVMFCGLAASVRPRRGEIVALGAIAAIFFGCIYADERALNRLETRMAAAVAGLAPGQRVVSALEEPNSRVNCLAHLIDRVCLGRCFSYANYEPSTAQFRVRANGENGIVVWQYGQSWGMQAGGYLVEARDLPLYQLDVCGPGGSGLCATPVKAGAVLQPTWLHVLPLFWNEKGRTGS